MAESYITRRGSASGGVGNLAVYTGDSLPTDKEYGIWANTTNQVDNIIIESPTSSNYSIEVFPVNNSAGASSLSLSTDETKMYRFNGSSYTNVDSTVTIYDMSSATSTSVDSGLNRTGGAVSTGIIPGQQDNTVYAITGGFYSGGNDYTNGVAYLVNLSTSTSTMLSNSGPTRSGTNLIASNGTILVYASTHQTSSDGHRYWRMHGFSTDSNTWSLYMQYKWSASSSTASRHAYLVPININGAEWYFFDQYSGNKLYYASTISGSMDSGISFAPPGKAQILFEWDGYIYYGNASSSSISRVPYGENPGTSELAEKVYTGELVVTTLTNYGAGIAYKGKNAVYWPGGNSIYKFNLIDAEYPSNSIIIRVSRNGYINLATIIHDNNMEVTIPVESIQYYDGSNITELSGSVRVYGGEWKTVV